MLEASRVMYIDVLIRTKGGMHKVAVILAWAETRKSRVARIIVEQTVVHWTTGAQVPKN